MIYLPDVTLVIVDDVAHDLAAMAIHECTKHVVFRQIDIHTDDPNRIPVSEANYYKTPKFVTKDDVMWYLWQEVSKSVTTSHFLYIQWDSWVINSARWTPEFLEYDYVGAPWPWHKDEHMVGNGGFSLRSTRLANYVIEQKYDLMGSSEDHILCRYHRAELETKGFRWAPVELAKQFSFECEPMTRDTFGYHAMFNWPDVLTKEQIQARLRVAPDYVRLHHYGYVQLQARMNGG